MTLERTPMTFRFRRARPEDAPACIALRGRTRENAFAPAALEALGITEQSWAAGIADGALPGHICMAASDMAGYCFGDRTRGEVAVLALLPEYEGLGLGKALLARVVEDLRAAGFERLFLSCAADASVRSHGFYRHLGWQATGQLDEAGDEILQWSPPAPGSGQGA